MSRYIDAENFANEIFRAWELWEKKGEDCFLFSDVITPMLVGQPTADVVEVVRCKDCKYGERKDYMPAKYCNLRYCKNSSNYHGKDFYCAMGEKRDE